MTWDDIVARVRELDARFRADGSLAWFRGERDATWALKSTIHRHLETLTSGFVKPLLTEHERIQLLRAEAKRIYRRFKADAWPLLSPAERNEWGVLFAMQHFGIPTRLLDWTESFACAVFFAQRRRQCDDTAAIWVLDPQALNHLSIQQDDLLAIDDDTAEPRAPTPRPPTAVARIDPRAWHPKWMPPSFALPTVAVAPIFTNPRMVAQRSAFALTGDSFEPVDRHLAALAEAGRLIKIILPPETYHAAQEYLSTAGLSAFTFYPDLEGLALKHRAETERQLRSARTFYPKFFEAARRRPNKRMQRTAHSRRQRLAGKRRR